MKHVITSIIVLTLSVLPACGQGSATDLTGRTWLLAQLDGDPPLESTLVDFTISGDIVSGSAGCNTYNGPAAVDDDGSLILGPQFAVTFKACAQPIMEQEQEYLEALARVASYRITDDELLLEEEDGTVVARFD